MDAPEKYSQNDEQFVIERFLTGNNIVTGKLLDIGAYAPAAFSNTKALIDKGWSGLLIEPSPGPFKGLLDHYANNPNVSLVNIAIASKPGFTQFYDSNGDAISTLDVAHKQKWEAGYGSKFTPFWVNAVTVSLLLDQFGYDFNLINLDVEGISAELALQLPYAKLTNTRLLCIEHDNRNEEIVSLVELFGFKQISFNGENIILAR